MINEKEIREIMLEKYNQMEKCHKKAIENYIYDIPIIINKRLKTTLGRFIHREINGNVNPLRFEFSYDFLKEETMDMITSVIHHEFIHLVANVYYNKRCRHGKEFKHLCKLYDVSNSGTSVITSNYRTSRKDNYEVICEDCGKVFFKRNKMSAKYINDLELNYTCPYCGGDILVNRI